MANVCIGLLDIRQAFLIFLEVAISCGECHDQPVTTGQSVVLLLSCTPFSNDGHKLNPPGVEMYTHPGGEVRSYLNASKCLEMLGKMWRENGY